MHSHRAGAGLDLRCLPESQLLCSPGMAWPRPTDSIDELMSVVTGAEACTYNELSLIRPPWGVLITAQGRLGSVVILHCKVGFQSDLNMGLGRWPHFHFRGLDHGTVCCKCLWVIVMLGYGL